MIGRGRERGHARGLRERWFRLSRLIGALAFGVFMATLVGCAVPHVDSMRDTTTEEGTPSDGESGPREEGPGTPEDDPGPSTDDPIQSDILPALAVVSARGSEEEGEINFPVTLTPASQTLVTVDYATGDDSRDGDDTAQADVDYTSIEDTLTFPSGTDMQTITVAVVPDDEDEEPETFTITLTNPSGARFGVASAQGTIVDRGALESPPETEDLSKPELTALQLRYEESPGNYVEREMYPAFDPILEHYAVTCGRAPTRVTAEALDSDTQLTLLRADPSDNQVAIGSIDGEVRGNDQSDIAIELRSGSASRTYVFHCVPDLHPEIRILTKSAGVSDGLLLITPTQGSPNFWTSWLTVVDNNGVPRFRRMGTGLTTYKRNFQRHSADRYSVAMGEGTRSPSICSTGSSPQPVPHRRWHR